MENNKKNLGSTVTPKKNRSLDLNALYKSKVCKVGDDDERIPAQSNQKNVEHRKRKMEMEVSLGRFESVAKKSRREDVICVKQNLGHAQKSDLSEGLKGISLGLSENGSGLKIPKRPRGSARRKRTEFEKISESMDIPKSVDLVGSSGEDHVISGEVADPINSLSPFAVSVVNNDLPTSKFGKEVVATDSKSKKADSGPTFYAGTSNSKLKRKDGVDEFNETRNSHGGEVFTTAANPDDTSSKNARKKIRKGNDFVAVRDGGSFLPKISEQSANCSNVDGRFSDFLDDDDEENLEKNAARMLSSRFDPNCTGFSSKRTASPQKAKRLSSTVSSSRDSINRDAFSSGGGEYDEAENNRALRPRREEKGKSASRKRRHFYELSSSDLDGRWMLKRRIKIFWPLDESWYHGLVNDYHSETKLHHIKYDDKDEEWVDLQKEKFKLLLLPSEYPGKTKSKQQSRGTKAPHISPATVESNRESPLDLEPISSWLTNSSQRVKAHTGSLNSQKALQRELPLKSSFSYEKADKPHSKVVNSDKTKTKISYKSVTEESLVVRGVIDKSVLETTSIHHDGEHVVYFRRKFRKITNNISLPGDITACGNGLARVIVGFPASVGKERNDSIDWMLKHEEFKLLVSLPELSLGKRDIQLIHDILVLHYGVLAPTSPTVVLDMLSIDNNHGLRFLLFEGCLKQALTFVFHTLVFLNQGVQPCDSSMELPVTSFKFGFSRPQNQKQQHVFSLAIYSFGRLGSSKWHHLESDFLRDCFLVKQLPASNCTYDCIKELEPDGLDPQKFHVDLELFLEKGSKEKLGTVGVSAEACNANLGKDTEDATPFSSSPNSLLNLHLHSLMEHSVSQLRSPSVCGAEDAEFFKSDPITSTQGLSADHENGTLEEDPEFRSLSASNAVLGRNIVMQNNVVDEAIVSETLQNGAQVDSEKVVNVNEHTEIGTKEQLCEQIPVSVPTLTPRHITCPASDLLGSSPDSANSNFHSGDDGFFYKKSLSSSLWPDGRKKFQDGVTRGPTKRPRTQVQYSLPYAAYDINAKQKTQNQRSLPCKRIRRASLKRISDGSRENQTKLDTFVINANVLVTHGDQGWRECGAHVVLEVADHSEWRIAVKLSGVVKYSYKVKHVMQPGSTNRFTYAMMWKGGKDWVLEFSDRSQWSLFKDIYEECYNRNMRAASVKNIPIPGVQLVEESSYSETEVPFIRNPTKYIRQFQSDAERALDPSRVIYDMDSDDEQWLMDKGKDGEEISEDYFEKKMDMLEKVSFALLRDKFTETEFEELLHETGSLEAAKLIYEHWLQKRERKGMPLIRHLQPPLWEIYQNQLKDWENNCSVALSTGPGNSAPLPEKPQVFAFCLKPRGLEVPNKVSRQRSQRRLSVSTHHHASYADQEGFLSSGRRSNGYSFEDERMLYSTTVQYSPDASPALEGSSRILSPRDGDYSLSNKDHDWNPYKKVFKNKARKYGRYPSLSNKRATPGRATAGKRKGGKLTKMVLPESSTQRQCNLEVDVDHLNDQYLEELRLRDAANRAISARRTAKIKRERAQRLLIEAERAMHNAVVALMTAEAMKGSSSMDLGVVDKSC